jgi:hypothetical protein
MAAAAAAAAGAPPELEAALEWARLASGSTWVATGPDPPRLRPAAASRRAPRATRRCAARLCLAPPRPGRAWPATHRPSAFPPFACTSGAHALLLPHVNALVAALRATGTPGAAGDAGAQALARAAAAALADATSVRALARPVTTALVQGGGLAALADAISRALPPATPAAAAAAAPAAVECCIALGNAAAAMSGALLPRAALIAAGALPTLACAALQQGEHWVERQLRAEALSALANLVRGRRAAGVPAPGSSRLGKPCALGWPEPCPHAAAPPLAPPAPSIPPQALSRDDAVVHSVFYTQGFTAALSASLRAHAAAPAAATDAARAACAAARLPALARAMRGDAGLVRALRLAKGTTWYAHAALAQIHIRSACWGSDDFWSGPGLLVAAATGFAVAFAVRNSWLGGAARGVAAAAAATAAAAAALMRAMPT